MSDALAQLDLLGWQKPIRFGANFGGMTYEPKRDAERLVTQLETVFAVMRPGDWLTLAQIELATGYPQASISARIRDFRHPEHGSHTVERRHVERGLFQYRLIENTEGH